MAWIATQRLLCHNVQDQQQAAATFVKVQLLKAQFNVTRAKEVEQEKDLSDPKVDSAGIQIVAIKSLP